MQNDHKKKKTEGPLDNKHFGVMLLSQRILQDLSTVHNLGSTHWMSIIYNSKFCGAEHGN